MDFETEAALNLTEGVGLGGQKNLGRPFKPFPVEEWPGQGVHQGPACQKRRWAGLSLGRRVQLSSDRIWGVEKGVAVPSEETDAKRPLEEQEIRTDQSASEGRGLEESSGWLGTKMVASCCSAGEGVMGVGIGGRGGGLRVGRTTKLPLLASRQRAQDPHPGRRAELGRPKC